MPVLHGAADRAEDHEDGARLDTAAGRARGSTDEHQDHQDEQACIRKSAQRICGKSSRTGRNTVKECAEPCDVFGQLQTDRTDDDQEAGHRDDHLRMQRELAKAALAPNFHDDQKTEKIRTMLEFIRRIMAKI